MSVASSTGTDHHGAALEQSAFDAQLQRRLDLVEAGLLVAARANTPLVTEAAQHVIRSGGKRFRPVLVLTAAALGADAVEADVVRAAEVVELTHVASLYHDDVMDEAAIRRGAPSANQRWQNSIAILVGDYLFARASDLVTELGTDYVRLQARTFARLVQGQIAETVGPDDDGDPVQHHLQVIADKTGSLIATSVVFGGMLAGLSESQVMALATYGEEIGLLFQLGDDLIDITSDSTGKTPGTDLREGVSTLPTLLLARHRDPASVRLAERIAGDLSRDDDLAEVLADLRRHQVLDDVRAELNRRADVAIGHLEPLPAGPARDALTDLARQLIDRAS